MSNQAIGDRAEKQRAQREAREAKDKEVKELKSKVSFSNLLEGKLEKLKGKSDKVKARVIAEIFANASGRVDTADGVFDVLPGAGIAGKLGNFILSTSTKNILPKTLARVILGHLNPTNLGKNVPDVFVTNAKGIKGLSADQIQRS